MFFRREHPRLLTVAVALVGDREVARELVQESLLRAFNSWPKVARLERPGGWTRRVLVNLCVDLHRRRGRERRALERSVPVSTFESPDVSSAMFWELVRRLPRLQRSVVALHYVDDLSVMEVSEVLGVTSGSVKTSLSRARADVDMPSAFPGTFPDGATVNRRVDTVGFHVATAAEAAHEFGGPIAVSAGFPGDATVQVVNQQSLDNPDVTYLVVTAETHDGFNRTSIVTSKQVLAPGKPVPNGYTAQDGLVCGVLSVDRCVGRGTPTGAATGALAGLPMSVFNGTIGINDGGVLFEVSGPDDATTTAAASTLKLVAP